MQQGADSESNAKRKTGHSGRKGRRERESERGRESENALRLLCFKSCHFPPWKAALNKLLISIY